MVYNQNFYWEGGVVDGVQVNSERCLNLGIIEESFQRHLETGNG